MSNHYDWNWVRFFEGQADSPLYLNGNVRNDALIDTLHELTWTQGLWMMIDSVPHLTDQQWLDWQTFLKPYAAQYHRFHLWCRLGQAMKDCSSRVQAVLDDPLNDAASNADNLMESLRPIEQFAVMGILYSMMTDVPKAQVLYFYLLRSAHDFTKPMSHILRFYNRLTRRQQDVALLAAYGYTNAEIADELGIKASGVADHLTIIYGNLEDVIAYPPNAKGTRYRLIHFLTRLFIRYPELLAEDIHAG